MKTYLGIDIAGKDFKKTGVVTVNEENGKLNMETHELNSRNPLDELKHFVTNSVSCAIDQPFAYPQNFMLSLQNKPKINTECTDDANYLWRDTDTKMRNILENYRLRKNYVLSPTRCQNLWNAHRLINYLNYDLSHVLEGKGKIFETHPRIALALILNNKNNNVTDNKELISNYKKSNLSPKRLCECRKKILKIIFNIKELERNGHIKRILNDDNYFEAFICALVAYWKHKGMNNVKACIDEKERISTEGAAWLPFLSQ